MERKEGKRRNMPSEDHRAKRLNTLAPHALPELQTGLFLLAEFPTEKISHLRLGDAFRTIIISGASTATVDFAGDDFRLQMHCAEEVLVLVADDSCLDCEIHVDAGVFRVRLCFLGRSRGSLLRGLGLGSGCPK